MFRLLLSHCIKPRVTSCSMLNRSRDFIGLAVRSLLYKHDAYLLQRDVLGRLVVRNSYSDDTSCQIKDMSDRDENIHEETRKEIAELLAIGWQAPEKISDSDIDHYLTLTAKKGRKKFLRFLFKKEILKKKDKMKKEEKARQKALLKESENADEDNDAFPNRFLLRIHNNTMQQYEKWRLAAGMRLGPKIAFDFSYEHLMRRQEVISLVQQLMHALNANKYAKDPFSIHWVGLTPETQSLQELKRLHGDTENIMVNDTHKDLLEVFPKEGLIYLSADSPNVLKTYDSDKVHVIGALVDRNIIHTGQSLARAKRFGLDHARLPLDKHLQWTTGAKNLTLDQVMKILIEMNTSGDWVKALLHVPIRKHAGLRSGPHWDQNQGNRLPHHVNKSGDSIQRNPSHYVSSRTRQSRTSTQRHGAGRRQQRNQEADDDTDSTLFTSATKSWFSDGH